MRIRIRYTSPQLPAWLHVEPPLTPDEARELRAWTLIAAVLLALAGGLVALWPMPWPGV